MNHPIVPAMPVLSQADNGLRSVTRVNLPAMAIIHRAAFPKSALTQLGSEAIRRYYEWQLVGPHQSVALSAYDGEDLAGFCIGGQFSGALSGFLNKNRLFLVRRILTHPWLLTNPLIRERFRFSAQVLRHKSKSGTPLAARASQVAMSFGILVIAVHPDRQGIGLGKRMMLTAESEARQRGYGHMHLTVNQDNEQALRFYEGLGWRKVFVEGLFRGRMTKSLAVNAS